MKLQHLTNRKTHSTCLFAAASFWLRSSSLLLSRAGRSFPPQHLNPRVEAVPPYAGTLFTRAPSASAPPPPSAVVH
jgi:hypothetical protein